MRLFYAVICSFLGMFQFGLYLDTGNTFSLFSSGIIFGITIAIFIIIIEN